MSSKDSKKSKTAEVVSIVAHQLKNPLSVIKGYLEILLLEDLGRINEKQNEYLSDALENVGRMTKIVNQLLDISRIEEKRYKLVLKKVSLENIIQEVIKDFSTWATASNSQLIFKKPKKLPKVIADPLKIRQVVENLISNALRYKSAGEGKVEIELVQKDGKVLFICRDNGIAIPKEDFGKIFSKFYRSEKAVELDTSGTGLGLYISKAIIKLNGGKIWFKRNKDFGMTFYFNLPIKK